MTVCLVRSFRLSWTYCFSKNFLTFLSLSSFLPLSSFFSICYIAIIDSQFIHSFMYSACTFPINFLLFFLFYHVQRCWCMRIAAMLSAVFSLLFFSCFCEKSSFALLIIYERLILWLLECIQSWLHWLIPSIDAANLTLKRSPVRMQASSSIFSSSITASHTGLDWQCFHKLSFSSLSASFSLSIQPPLL